MSKQKTLEDLRWWLTLYHSKYTASDLKPSKNPGYLVTTEPCTCTYPPFDGYTIKYHSGAVEPHYHTLNIAGQRKGYGQGIYALA